MEAEMGLDQFAVARRAGSTERREIAYWRKHPNLQGWMESLWRSRGGVGEFNLVDVVLSTEDIDRLENDVRMGLLPPTTGFFYGLDSDDHYRDRDLDFVARAREAIAAGEEVVYRSWW